MPERYERVLVSWHCAKVKGRVELKIEKPRVKTFSYDFPKLHHSNRVTLSRYRIIVVPGKGQRSQRSKNRPEPSLFIDTELYL